MKSSLKTMKAGAGAEPGADTPIETLGPISDVPVVHNAEQESTPPDIIVE